MTCDYTTDICHYFTKSNLKYLVMTKYDIDLKDLYDRNMKYFDDYYKKMLLMKIFTLLEDIHKKGVIHQDIKLSNFTYNFKENKVYLIDFGSSFIQLCLTIPGKESSGKITGTARYASLNAHNGNILTPYDDIESLLYVFLELELNSTGVVLPWSGKSKNRNSVDKWKIIYNIKKHYLIENYHSHFLPRYFNRLIRLYNINTNKMQTTKVPLKINYQGFKNILLDDIY